MRRGATRLLLFVLAEGVLAVAFAAVVRTTDSRSPVGIVALLAVELTAIAVALAFHLRELPAPSRTPRAHAVPVDPGYL